MISLQKQQPYNSGVVASSLLTQYYSYYRFHKNQLALRTQSLKSTLNPKASLRLSAQTLQTHLTSPTNYLFLPEITNLCEAGNLTEALTLLQLNVQNENATSNLLQTKAAMGILLHACAHNKDIDTGRTIHEIVSKSDQYRNDSVLSTRLITMYAMCGSALDSFLVFDNLHKKNLVQWNALVSGYTRNELYFDAINMFVQMIKDAEFIPDNFTFPSVIKASGGVLDAGLGKVIHGMVIKMGLVLDVFVGNSLIAMYGKCRLIDEAVKVFDYIPVRNLVSWNSMICGFSENGFSHESLNVLVEMLVGEEGLSPDVATIVTVLSVCAREGEIEMGMGIHGFAVKLRLSDPVIVNNALVDMYSKCGYLFEAQMLFDKNNSKNVVSWNTMIGGLSAEGYIYESFSLLRKMQMQGKIKANEVTLLNILPVCSENSQLRSLKELHGYSIRHGFQYHELVANAFVAGYANCGSMRSADYVFNIRETKTLSSWNALIVGYARNGDPKQALNLFIQMINSGLEPDRFSMSCLLLACIHLKSLHRGKEVHGFVVRNRLQEDSFICTSLLSLYMHFGKLSSARLLFDRMENKSLVSWNAMISGYSQNGFPEQTLSLFSELLSNGIKPCDIAIVSVVGACSQLSALRLGKENHCYALKSSLAEGVFVGCSIIDMYAKNGCVKESRRVFDGLRDKNLASWNAIIGAYGVHGHGKEAIELFEKMKKVSQMPDSVTFLSILTACSHAGLIEAGLNYFKEMQNSYAIEPRLEHYSCVVDMLGRAGQFSYALRFVNTMPMQPDSRIWSSLLSSCSTVDDLEICEEVAVKLLELEPKRAENHVLLSNLYARWGRWDDVRRVRQVMKDIGLKKDAGCSWIELDGKVHNFTAGNNLTQEASSVWPFLED